MAEYNANCPKCQKPAEDGAEALVIHHKVFVKTAVGWALPHRNEIQASREANGLGRTSPDELPDRFTWIHAACLVPGVWGTEARALAYGKLKVIRGHLQAGEPGSGDAA